MTYDIDKYPARSGRFIGEDGKTYNIVELLKNSSGGGNTMDFLYGDYEPGNDIGSSGDVYLRVTNGDFYKKEDNWVNIANFKGPQGNPGATGATGATGDPGRQGDQGPPGKDAEQQFTADQVAALLELIELEEGE